MRSIVRLSMALVALAAAALSYQSLMQLAVFAGYGRLAVLYPLVVDAGAAASCAAWLHNRGRQPLVMTWCLLAVSVILNGTTHYLESTGTAPSWLLVVAVAAVPPTVLGLTVHLAVDMRRPGQQEDNPRQLTGSTALPFDRFEGSHDVTAQPSESSRNTRRPGQPDSEHRPDRLTDPDEEPAGPAASRAPERHPSPTRDLGGKTPSPDMRRPDQGGCRPPLAGPSASMSAELRDLTDATRTGDPQHTKSLDLAGGPDTGQPGRECDLEPAGPSTRGVSTSADQNTRADNPLSQLIEAGAGRRRIAAELGVTEYRARKLQEASKNGDGS